MNYLSAILLLKIVFTFITIVMPFMLMTKEKLDKIMQITAGSICLYRLYGVAVLSILFAYSGGIYQSIDGVVPWTVIIMGLVSNIGGTLVLLFTGVAKKQRFQTTFYAVISILLFSVVLYPEWSIKALV